MLAPPQAVATRTPRSWSYRNGEPAVAPLSLSLLWKDTNLSILVRGIIPVAGTYTWSVTYQSQDGMPEQQRIRTPMGCARAERHEAARRVDVREGSQVSLHCTLSAAQRGCGACAWAWAWAWTIHRP
jgi:hypothetical protein